MTSFLMASAASNQYSQRKVASACRLQAYNSFAHPDGDGMLHFARQKMMPDFNCFHFHQEHHMLPSNNSIN
jgi:hypothetical protein